MARARTKAVELARLLNAAGQPIYVLDDEPSIVFCNRALLEWVGRDAEQMEGLRCAYHSSSGAGSLEALAAGLCPPPAAMSGQPLEGTVEVPLPDGRTARRRARFVPLDRAPGDTVSLIVLVEGGDLPEGQEKADSVEPETVRLHERIRRFRRQAAVRYGAERLLGDSPMIRRARAQIELAAGSRAAVLVVGPPGSGRQHVAAAIHYAGDPEAAGSMIPLACGVLGTELIHSTINALVSGDWSSESAAPATLVLNQADRLPPEIQRELVDVLTGKTFPLRTVATAEMPLNEIVRRGEYREDLAAALSTVTIELPPLARRRQDLPLLAQLFLEGCNARGRKQLAGFSPEALDRLDGYDWPGNVDELFGMVAEAHDRAEGPEITPADLPERIRLAAAARAHPRRAEETIVLDEFLARIERELITRALARAKGNKAQAARLLGMTRPRLYRRLVQLGLVEEEK